ncbi:uncharacterized protein K452DRAFT_223752 [Aplosporella prunicola CBS 121167]|uniref:COP9 signalosome complex subunit 6 n=1 Tax=Aplosporella prunicola CBS 121167 TaxID=1176127 RepID=A0A6A6BKB0_9PEZI|nr:uncharacterized protein K452DRAFT_223752 [Aplosporella prunicola CBS 121167]KAF2144078.1 hypothetical protein K452DRAFT_223752 [Aplosporella prunicola CBS 121167]
MADAQENPLISATRASDTSPQIQLHPLVLLTVSDYITRHTLRQQQGPVIGAIIGQQHGRDITMEVAFECNLLSGENGDVVVDDEWFRERLEQYKTVYKSPALDLVGWFTLGAPSGPSLHHLPVHEYFHFTHNESALLLLFHPESVLEGNATGGKLPLTIYESVWEGSSESNDQSAAMDIDGGTQGQDKKLKFRDLVYSVETGEAEMIAVDFVAQGGGNATAVDTSKAGAGESSSKGKSKGKSKAESERESAAANGTAPDGSVALTSEDEELLASLTAKANAIKMLRARINLLEIYISKLPPSYLTDAILPVEPTTEAPNYEILRSIQSLLSRLPLLTPLDRTTFAREAAEQRSDVELTNMLASITGSVFATSELGKKFSIVEMARSNKKMNSNNPFAFDGMPGAAPSGGFFETMMNPVGGSAAYASPGEGRTGLKGGMK